MIDTAFYIEPKIELDLRWAYYQLLTQNINGMDSGSAIPSTSRDSFYNLDVLLPPIEEQRKISNILGTIDDKIDLNRRMNQTLEEIARTIFKSWFVNFEPVRAKAEGLDTGLPAEIAALFPDSFEESPLGEIPQGWRVVRIDEVAGINELSITKEFQHICIEYVDISSVDNGRLLSTTPYELNQAPSRAKRLVRNGDTIWSCVRPNRKSFLYIKNPKPNMVVSTGFAVLSPKIVPSSFLYFWTTTNNFVDYLSSNADGSAYPAVRPEHFNNAPILLPDKLILDAFHKICSSSLDLIWSNEQQNLFLVSIRDRLLPKLMNGEIQSLSCIF